jgi:hypothetical protein
MDEFSLRVERVSFADGETVPAIEPVVNGTRLLDLVGDDSAAPLAADDVLRGTWSLWAPGSGAQRLSEDGRVAVLTCGCGDFGCGGVSADIEDEGDRVVWRDFHEANGGPVIAVGPFTFDRARYERALLEATKLLETVEWSGWEPFAYEPHPQRDDGATTPEAAAMTGYTPEANAHVLAIVWIDADSAWLGLDTVPSHPMQVSCARFDGQWYELAANG